MKYYFVKNEKQSMKNWKNKNKRYISEMQRFLDRASNIKDEELQESIILQMLKCDKILTDLSEKMFKKYYLKGYKNAKRV